MSQQLKVVEAIMTLELKRNNIIETINKIDYKLHDDDLRQMKSNVENSSIINIIYQLKSNDHAREDKIRKCRFNNRGYCKFKEKCKNVHAENVCEDFLQKEKCETKGCSLRHPKNCFYWGKIEGCTRENLCKYLHRESKKYCIV